jgi:hypothetical protein
MCRTFTDKMSMPMPLPALIRPLLWTAASLLGACAPVIPASISPEGNGVYLVTQSSTAAWLDSRSAALKRADAYCQKQNKHVQLLTPEILNSPAEASDHAELEFRCE